MEAGVSLGGRHAPGLRTRVGYEAYVWLPVVFMLLLIARESTDGLSSAHTATVLRPLLQGVFGHIQDARWDSIHHGIRKTGHFLGYGTLGLTWLRAWLLRWMLPLRLQPVGVWRRYAGRMAICCTALVASLDELHQTSIPSRTGMAEDVLLDTLGAIVLCGAVAVWWRFARRSGRMRQRHG